MTEALRTTLAHRPTISRSVFVAHTDADYERLISLLDELIDEVGNDESHPLASLMEVIGLLIEKYEDDHVPELEDSSVREEPPA
jgi:HTH-type transcriptional regulator/antitoxin HigA